LRHASGVLVVLLLALCAGPIAGATAADAAPERMIAAINKARERASLPPLRTAPELERSAGAFARWLLTHDTLEHRPKVSTTRAYRHCGEALSMHFSLRAQVGSTLRAWLGSARHRALVLTPSMDRLGVGHARGRHLGRPRTIWVVQVARR
jgi:uncharacterized protein YkwD